MFIWVALNVKQRIVAKKRRQGDPDGVFIQCCQNLLEIQHFHIANLCEVLNFLKCVFRHIGINADKSNRFLTFAFATEVKGGNVDPGFPQNCTQRTDKARLVEIVDVENVWTELRVQRHALDLNNLRNAADNRASDIAPCACNFHADADQIVINRAV